MKLTRLCLRLGIMRILFLNKHPGGTFIRFLDSKKKEKKKKEKRERERERERKDAEMFERQILYLMY